jgi:hypothetical protein
MGILTVGLLGVAAIFPVAGFYMQKGDVADRSSAIAQAAFNHAVASGQLDPENWLMYEPVSPTVLPPNNAAKMRQSYSKRFASGLRDELAAQSTQTDSLLRNRSINTKYGYVYALDPLGANSSSMAPSDPLIRQQAASSQRLPIGAQLTDYSNYSHWWPWSPANGSAAAEVRWPVMRVTLEQPPGEFQPWPLTNATADKYFRSSDDLALDVPTQADQPSQQVLSTFDLDGDGSQDPLSRQSQGNYSWIATVVPASSDARDALAIDPHAYEYEVAVAVFYKRVLDDALDANRAERLMNAKVISIGLSGGELLVTNTAAISDPFKGLKEGNWVPVCGPHPMSSKENPKFVFRWYRVLAVEKEVNGIIDPANAANQRLVTLRGPQWPWQPSTNLGSSELSNNLCLVVLPNVVAVHSKTIQLGDHSSWSIQ